MIFLGQATYAENSKSCDEKDSPACPKHAFDVGLTALYFKAYSDSLPTNSIDSNVINPSYATERNNVSFTGPWGWSGIIDGRYHLSDQSDVNLSWMYYSFDYNGTSTFNFIDKTSEPSYIANSTTTVSGKITINSVNAEFAQSFALSTRSMARIFAGAQYLNVADKSTLFYHQTDPKSPDVFSSTFTNNKYEGIGPRIGLDANYKLKGNFSVFANSATTILLARNTLSASSGFSSFGNLSDNLRTKHKDIAIPELEAKLGLTYHASLAHGAASLSAGWTVINYFNMLGDNRSNLTLSGPFLQGKWEG